MFKHKRFGITSSKKLPPAQNCLQKNVCKLLWLVEDVLNWSTSSFLWLATRLEFLVSNKPCVLFVHWWLLNVTLVDWGNKLWAVENGFYTKGTVLGIYNCGSISLVDVKLRYLDLSILLPTVNEEILYNDHQND